MKEKTLITLVNYTAPDGPVDREDVIYGMLQSGVSFSSRMTRDPEHASLILHEVVRRSEWFDFGNVDFETLSKTAVDAEDFMKTGLLHPPHHICCFRFRSIPRELGPDRGEAEFVLIIMHEGTETVLHLISCSGPRGSKISDVGAMSFVEKDRYKCIGQDKETSKAVGTVYLGLWTILNTRGISKTIREPDERMNKARAKVGAPPLRRVTVVASHEYIRAFAETERMERGDHIPRAPHIRRGHLRRYTSERFHRLPENRRVIWIEPMKINVDDYHPPEQRDSYRVEEKK